MTRGTAISSHLRITVLYGSAWESSSPSTPSMFIILYRFGRSQINKVRDKNIFAISSLEAIIGSIELEDLPLHLEVHLARKWYKMCIKESVISMEARHEKIYIRQSIRNYWFKSR